MWKFILPCFWPQVLVGLFGSSLRMLALVPGSHGYCIRVQGPKSRSLPQVLVGLFGSSLRMLDLMPGSHGPAPFQQATVNLLAYCTRAPWACMDRSRAWQLG